MGDRPKRRQKRRVCGVRSDVYVEAWVCTLECEHIAFRKKRKPDPAPSWVYCDECASEIDNGTRNAEPKKRRRKPTPPSMCAGCGTTDLKPDGYVKLCRQCV